MSKANRTTLVGAAFLMATSAIGPGFLTQTTVFTSQLRASFGFAILVSVVFDIMAQLNIWRVLVGSGERAQVVANRVTPGLGHVLSVLVALGGLAFNIGNVAGAGLGLNVLFGVPVAVGAVVSAVIAIGIFLVRNAGRAMDRFTQVLGGLMVVVACYVAVAAAPPLGEAVLRTFVPLALDPLAIVTIVGGTVGGYITFAGAHRLVDAGLTGPAAVPEATRAALLGIGVATIMRVVLFLGAFGVVSSGAVIDPANPPASVFRAAAGDVGYRFFGIVMWAAAITSVVGSAYTSVSFLTTLGAWWHRSATRLIIGFISLSTVVFLVVGRPVSILVMVGAVNGLILPLGLGVMLVASRREPYRSMANQPGWLVAGGGLVAIAMLALGVYTMFTLFGGPRGG